MNKLRFMHFRRPRIDIARGGVILGPTAANGGVTVAYTEHEENGMRYLKCAFARCNRTDAFEKKEGRGVAQTRFNEGEVCHALLTQHGTRHTLLGMILEHPAMRRNVRAEVRRVAHDSRHLDAPPEGMPV